jgi:ABC-type Na+ efflux pump permease subunit
MPSVSLMGLSVALLVSIRAKSFMEAQQIAGVVVLPFVVLVAVQVAGLVVFNALYVILFSLVLLAVTYLIVSRTAPRFTREGIISTLQ